jgi:hypothetical protein
LATKYALDIQGHNTNSDCMASLSFLQIPFPLNMDCNLS